jgi:hypothetical protein
MVMARKMLDPQAASEVQLIVLDTNPKLRTGATVSVVWIVLPA